VIANAEDNTNKGQPADSMDKGETHQAKESLQEAILREAVRLCINDTLRPTLAEVQVFIKTAEQEWERVKNIVMPVLDNKFAQCPHCGHMAMTGTMCEDLTFICPDCACVSHWTFHDKTGRYTLK
jgi:6-pyruvoyl-tetrahydropterin synthase